MPIVVPAAHAQEVPAASPASPAAVEGADVVVLGRGHDDGHGAQAKEWTHVGQLREERTGRGRVQPGAGATPDVGRAAIANPSATRAQRQGSHPAGRAFLSPT
jgi:hypothetical protein